MNWRRDGQRSELNKERGYTLFAEDIANPQCRSCGRPVFDTVVQSNNGEIPFSARNNGHVIGADEIAVLLFFLKMASIVRFVGVMTGSYQSAKLQKCIFESILVSFHQFFVFILGLLNTQPRKSAKCFFDSGTLFQVRKWDFYAVFETILANCPICQL